MRYRLPSVTNILHSVVQLDVKLHQGALEVAGPRILSLNRALIAFHEELRDELAEGQRWAAAVMSHLNSATHEVAEPTLGWRDYVGVFREIMQMSVSCPYKAGLYLGWFTRGLYLLSVGTLGLIVGCVIFNGLHMFEGFCDAQLQRQRAFREILRDRSDPVYGWELCLWLCTRARHLDVALGDFREEYDQRLEKHGYRPAIAWCRRRILTEAASRLTTFWSLGSRLRSVYHFLRNHLK